MSTTLGIRGYSDYNWRDYEVRDPKQVPRTSHYAACIFDTYYTDGGYSAAEGGGPSPVPFLRYYAFPNKDALEQWIGEATQSKKDFFIFGARMGEAQVRVEVGVSL